MFKMADKEDGSDDDAQSDEIVEKTSCSNQSTKFAKNLTYGSNGNVVTVDFTRTRNDGLQENSHESYVEKSVEEMIVIENQANDINGENVVGKITRKFQINYFSSYSDGNENENNNNIKASDCVEKKKENLSRILFCFVCKSRFEERAAYAEHSKKYHGIKCTKMDAELLNRQVPSIIQISSDGVPCMQFMKELTDDVKIAGCTKSLVEKTENVVHSVQCSIIKSDDAFNPDALRHNEMKMDGVKDEGSEESLLEISRKSPITTESSSVHLDDCTEHSTKVKLESLTEKQTSSDPSSFQETNSIHSQDTDLPKSKYMSAVSDHSVRRSPPFQPKPSKGPVSLKLKDSVYGAAGVTNMDPLFHMSIFQSRNSCKTLKCPKCNWHYKYRQTLDAHMKEKHSDETSDCIYCNTNQPHPRLSRGESYACGYKPFKCEVCNYSTTTKGNLSIHMQSDKHLYNVKTIQQHQRQHQNKDNRDSGNDASSGRMQLDKVPTTMQQHTSDSQLQKGFKDIISSSTSGSSSNNRRQPWRCDVCNYVTDIPRNLRIHMQSEKHCANAELAASTSRHMHDQGIKLEPNVDDDVTKHMNVFPNKKEAELCPNPTLLQNFDQSNPSLAALYYYLASVQNQMQNPVSGPAANALDDQDNRRKQLIAQQQQLLLAQQYQQMLSQFTGTADGGASTAVFHQQLVMQQQIQLLRHLFAQSDKSTNPPVISTDTDINLQDVNSPLSTSDQYLFTCGICCNFSCNDFESLSTHVRTPRYSRTSLEESEWVTKSPSDGYLCRLCNYTTQLKTNFSLHCKTEKHTSKLQLINHIREGGEANEWKISYAIAGNNMNKVTCNGCQHSASNIDKLRIHCSTDRHQGTLTMCHYFDSILKDAELNKGLATSEEAFSHRLSCRPCSYKSKFVVGMLQHMQCQSHQAKLHNDQHTVNYAPDDIVTVEKDTSEMENGSSSSTSMPMEEEKKVILDFPSSEALPDTKVYKCKLCVYETSDKTRLQEHNDVQHFSQSTIKCPMCPEYLSDTAIFQAHLIEVHKLTEQATPSPSYQSQESQDLTSNREEEVLQAIPTPLELQEPTESSDVDGSSSPKQEKTMPLVGSVLHSNVTQKKEMEPDSLRKADENNGSCEFELGNNSDARSSDTKVREQSLHGKTDGIDQAILSNPGVMLREMCTNAKFLESVMLSADFAKKWELLDPPFACSLCSDHFGSKTDLLNHLTTSTSHKMNLGNRKDEQDAERQEQLKPPSLNCGKAMQEQTTDNDQNAIIDERTNTENIAEDYHNQGISKSAQKRVLQDVGFDQVSHFVENRTDENRARSQQWKKGSTKNEKSSNTEEPISSTTSELTCGQCGKEFSNSWILKVHEKSVHNLEMSTEMLNEFIQGYTSWYWECLKKDSELGHINERESEHEASYVTDQNFQKGSEDRLLAKDRPMTDPSLKGPTSVDEQDLKNTTLQALMKDYLGILPPMQTGFPSQINSQRQLITDDQTKIQQQQILLQFLMNAQLQASMQQQGTAGAQSHIANQPSNSTVMNMLVEHLYGAAAQGAAPNFMDPMAMMALLQQQQSRVPGNATVNQWLAMRYLQQQQMQQLLMYPPAMEGNCGSIPFAPNVADNNAQRQMLSTFAASLLGPGVTQDSQTLMNNPLASALHAYQLQAAAATAAAAAVGDGRGKENDAGSSKMLCMQQLNNATPTSHSHQSQTEIPTKRPRTRITDDQLKVLRSNFDINTSPGEDQISEMAHKTNLPPKVIKHWFRNTLFKERQRSKDSPYNFNIPPMTSLDDINTSNQRPVSDSPQGSCEVPLSNQTDGNDLANAQDLESSEQCDLPVKEGESTIALPDKTTSVQKDAMQILKSLGCQPEKLSEAQQFYSNPLAYITKLSRGCDNENSTPPQLPAEFSRKPNLDGEFPHFDAASYLFNRQSHDYSYQGNSSHGNMSTITRRTPRTRFSDYQLKVLQEFFDKNAYPKDEDLDRLSRLLELSTRVIVVWFQNARQKARKSFELQHGSMSQHGGSSNSSSLGNFSRKRQLSPSSPTHSPANRSLDLHTASKNFSLVSRDVSLRPVIKEEASFQCSQCDFSFPTVDTLRDHEKLHSASNISTVIQQYKHSDRSSEAYSKEKAGMKFENGKEERQLTSPDADSKISRFDLDKQSNIDDIISRFGLHSSMKTESFEPMNAASMTQSPQLLHRGDFIQKQRIPSPPSQMLPIMTSPKGTTNIKRKGMADSNKDPKRLRTTITPEQLEFLYQQYLVDSSPSRKVIEQISDIVGLKKRVVQVWFQNTRARERKGQFRSVGRITSVLGVPQTCPHCRVTFRTKADLDAHVRYKHTHSPTAVTTTMPLSKHISATTGYGYPSIVPSSRDESRSKFLGQSVGFGKPSSSSEPFNSFGSTPTSDDGEPSPKRQKSSSTDSDHFKPHGSSPVQSLPARTFEIYKAVTEQIFRNRVSSASAAISSQGQSKPHSVGATKPNKSFADAVISSNSGNRPTSPSPVSSPESMGSAASNPLSVPSKRYRTQMTSLQVSALKHCFTEYKTPTLLECETLGDQIGLPKRVIQVWFQNARAKEKKNKQGDIVNDDLDSPEKSSCSLCLDERFGSHQDYRNHIFSKSHLFNFIKSVGGETEFHDSTSHSPGYESDECTQRDSVPSSPDVEGQFCVSNGLNLPFSEHQGNNQWNTIAKKYQQISAKPDFASNISDDQSNDQSNDRTSQKSDGQDATLQAFRQVWLQQALLANGFTADPKARPFEGMASTHTTSKAE